MFCRKYRFDGERVVKRHGRPLNVDNPERYKIKRGSRMIDESDYTVPMDYHPMSEKEAEVASSYDYDFIDMRTTDQLESDLTDILASMQLKGRRLF